jgi:peptide deformylase
MNLPRAELRVEVYRDESQTAVRITHLPTGHTAQAAEDHGLLSARDAAMAELEAKIAGDPVAQMRSLGIIQEGDPVLAQVASRFDLPAEEDEAVELTTALLRKLDQLRQVHDFPKGMGIAAPQIGVSRAAAVVRAPDGDTTVLLNPRIRDQSAETDDQHEGCLSFFGVRGLVRRPLRVEVEFDSIAGQTRWVTMHKGAARLACHEIDHLNGVLYRSRLVPGSAVIPVAEYEGEGKPWTYLEQG